MTLTHRISNRMERAKANKQHVFLSFFSVLFGLLGGKCSSGRGRTDKTIYGMDFTRQNGARRACRAIGHVLLVSVSASEKENTR